jgi:hypothetical protein
VAALKLTSLRMTKIRTKMGSIKQRSTVATDITHKDEIAFVALSTHAIISRYFFFNPLLFASCTDTFSKWCKITRGMKSSAQ